MTSKPSRRLGFTLVELMVAMVAGLIVSAAALSFFFSSMVSNSEYVQSTRLSQELRNSLDLITRDLRRAGYDEAALGYLGSNTGSPLTHVCRTTGGSNTCITNGAAADCVIYASDSGDNSGVDGAVDLGLGEVRGIRFRKYTVNGVLNTGVIEYAVSKTGISPTCGGAGPDYTAYPVACNGLTTWCPLSDPTRLNVSSLTITDVGANTGGVQLRDLDVVLQGKLVGTSTFTRGVKSSIRIRSDCYGTSSVCNASP
jgi:prepilin-type N-terminal cleavage/methylation domain-containing protein